MPAKPRKSNDTQPATIVLRLPGKQKNRLVEHAEKLGVAYTNWCIQMLMRALDEELGLPEPPPARAPIPTQTDMIHAYLTGDKILLPCGREGVGCAGTDSPERFGGASFCPECRIRVA